MTAEKDILNRLLDKYENSKHLTQLGVSHRRVMLSKMEKELPGYTYEVASVRDAYHMAARELEQKGLVTLEWLDNHLLLSCIILQLEQVMVCYERAGRIHPAQRSASVVAMITTHLHNIKTPWIKSWAKETCTKAKEQMQIPAFCKENLKRLEELLVAFRTYDAMQESMTMRAFSSKCFCDTKYFERNIRELFLRIARRYDANLSLACEEHALGLREQLAVLGIYARHELYELAGNCTLQTKYGKIDVGATSFFGLAIPGTLVDEMVMVDMHQIHCITFIENKTNYDEYLLSERTEHELVVYHGGFMSPQKRKFFGLLAKSAISTTDIRFWADIDLGGFQMFWQLQQQIPQLQPMRMEADFVEQYHKNGLIRSDSYLQKLQTVLENGAYPMFSKSIMAILKYGVTIEQETFLNSGNIFELM